MSRHGRDLIIGHRNVVQRGGKARRQGGLVIEERGGVLVISDKELVPRDIEERGGVLVISDKELVPRDIEELSDFLESWLRMRGLRR